MIAGVVPAGRNDGDPPSARSVMATTVFHRLNGARVAEPLAWSHAVLGHEVLGIGPTGRWLLSEAQDRSLELGNLRTEKSLDLLGGFESVVSPPTVAAFSSNGEWLVVARTDGVFLWRTGSRSAERTLGHDADVTQRLLACETPSPCGEIEAGAPPIDTLAVSDDGRFVVAHYEDGVSLIVDGEQRAFEPRPLGRGAGLRNDARLEGEIVFSANGNFLIETVGGPPFKVLVWPLNPEQDFANPIVSTDLRAQVVSVVAVGNVLATGNADGMVVFFDLSELDATRELEPRLTSSAHAGAVTIVSSAERVPSDSRILSLGERDGRLRIWPLKNVMDETAATAGGMLPYGNIPRLLPGVGLHRSGADEAPRACTRPESL